MKYGTSLIAALFLTLAIAIPSAMANTYLSTLQSRYTVLLEDIETSSGPGYIYHFSISANLLSAIDQNSLMIRYQRTDTVVFLQDGNAFPAGGCNGSGSDLYCWVSVYGSVNSQDIGSVRLIVDDWSEASPQFVLSDCEISEDAQYEDGIDLFGTDIDEDGLANASDNCPLASNADQLDTDGDGFGDACDDDRDNDGIPNAVDNCKLVANANQLNTDNDFTGDACDENDDGDYFLDVEDNCPLISNDQNDCDGDGVGDACDADYDGECGEISPPPAIEETEGYVNEFEDDDESDVISTSWLSGEGSDRTPSAQGDGDMSCSLMKENSSPSSSVFLMLFIGCFLPIVISASKHMVQRAKGHPEASTLLHPSSYHS